MKNRVLLRPAFATDLELLSFIFDCKFVYEFKCARAHVRVMSVSVCISHL